MMKSIYVIALITFFVTGAWSQSPDTLPGTTRLTMEGDITSQLVDGVDRYLLNKLERARINRIESWPKPTAAATDYAKSTADFRRQLAKQIGLRDDEERTTAGLFYMPDVKAAQVTSQLGKSPYVAEGQDWKAAEVRWSVLPGVDGQGLLLEPNSSPKFFAIVIPDAGQTPEDLCGIGKSDRPAFHAACYLAAAGGRVVVPSVIGRTIEARREGSGTLLTDQEFLYRSAYELGRHIVGYQLHEFRAATDLLNVEKLPVIVAGWGEGGWLAMYHAATDQRVRAACISGHFQPRDKLWQEPIHRNVFGLLNFAGDAQLAALVAPRHVVIDPVPGPAIELVGQGGAPGTLPSPDVKLARQEFETATEHLKPWKLQDRLVWIEPSANPPAIDGCSTDALKATLKLIGVAAPAAFEPTTIRAEQVTSREDRRRATLVKWERYTQRLLNAVAAERTAYWKPLLDSKREEYAAKSEPYRDYFREHIIGWWGDKMLPAQPRSRKLYDNPAWTGYEVVLDVFPDVIAYGILLVPKNLPAGEKRPCVVFQHGLEGRPQDVVTGDHPAYHDVAAKLAERGFISFAPQNLYIFKDRFRTLQRKSYLLGKTLFSTIIPQHQQIVRWLGQLPQVDANRIAFYGLSYGGKSAMRIPPLVPEYSLSICSADFNDWVWKNATTYGSHSYVWTGEYEIFEFDLGTKFNYAEMAFLIAPRPFMVERGHFDGVAPDDRVGMEFAKIRNLYATKLMQPLDCEIEWFVGPHTINGQRTYEFLHEKLQWPKPR